MRVTIASAGPSLLASWPPPGDLGVVIAVNLALVHLRSCDYFSAGDWDTIYRLVPGTIVRQGYCTTADVARLIGLGSVVPCFALATDHRVLTWESLPLGFTPRWSGVAAFGLAAALGATEVVVAGCDMAGTDDCAAVRDCDRAHRWAEERSLIAAAEEVLRARGALVTYWNG